MSRSWKDQKINDAKDVLAYELTALVHGKEEADKAREASRALFAGGADDSNMPTTELDPSVLKDGAIQILDLMTACGLAPSRAEARRLVQQGGVFVEDEKVPNIDFAVTEDQLKAGVKIRRGKKVFHKAVLKA